VIVPGARLSGRLVVPAGLSASHVSVRPKDHDYPAAFRDAVVNEDGTYVLDGLQAGTWVVGVWPHRLVEGDTVEVTIAEGEPGVRFDLNVTRK